MILSVSRRTDIPAFYTPWFMNRLREGFVMVRSPMNRHQVALTSRSHAIHVTPRFYKWLAEKRMDGVLEFSVMTKE